MKSWWRLGPLIQLSWTIALATLAPLLAGVLLDRWLGTKPLFILIGGLLGILAGTVGAVRITTRAIESLAPPDAPQAPDAAEGKEDQP